VRCKTSSDGNDGLALDTNCYGSGSLGCRHVPTMDKKDYFLLLAC
jgi:hypothetical protein